MTDNSYAKLLEDLRRDLQLDPATDVLGGVLISLSGKPVFVEQGLVQLVWTASFTSAPVTVTHGLPTTPRVFLQARSTPNCLAFVTALTPTTFTVQADQTNATAFSGTVSYDWMAITS